MTFREKKDARGVLIECEIAGCVGRARVFSTGVEDAKRRAEAEARAMVLGEALGAHRQL